MSERDLQRRPEGELAAREKAEASPREQAPAVDATARQEARLWRQLGASRTPESAGDAASLAVEHRGAGQPVDPQLAASVGAHTGTNISDARVHKDPLSQQATRAMGARAFAYGKDVFLGPGEHENDRAMMAHELTHVAQQAGGTATPQRKVDVGADSSPAEQHADQVAAQVNAGSPPPDLLVDAGPLAEGQMLKSAFLERLKPFVVSVADHELGRIGSAVACPYIAQYFQKYGALPASAGMAMVRRWIPASRDARTAEALLQLILDRVRAGVQFWKEKHALPPDLAAAEPAAAQAAQAFPGGPQAQKMSLGSLEADLGPGEAVDSRFAAPFGAEGARIHRGPEAAKKAADHGAVAFAVGQNVVMGAGAPEAGTPHGDALLAHELAHTAQQRDAAKDPAARMMPIGGESQAAEVNADRVASLGMFAGRIGDVMRTNVQLQRCSGEAAAKDINSKSYYDEHEHEIAATAADQIETFPFVTGDPAAKFASGGNEKFAKAIAAQLRGGDVHLRDIILPESVGVLLDQSRVMTQQTYTDPADGQEKTQTTNFGPDRYFEGTGITLANAVARRTNESLKREVPRYVQAKLATVGEPSPNGLLVSHPIDPLILTALAAGGVLDIDKGAFAKEHPDLAGSPKPISKLPAGVLVQEKDPKRSQWYRLTLPEPAPAEQIALTLLDDQTQAYRIEVAHPLYGVKQTGDENLIDELQDGKQDGLIDEIALNQAQALGMPSTNPPSAVIAQIRTNALTIRTSVNDAAMALGYQLLGPYADKLSERASRLETAHNDADTKKWDVQSRAQFEIIKQAAKGLDADRKRQTAYTAQFGKDAIPEAQRQALFEDATMWADAVKASDAVKTAEGMLQSAFEHSATLEMRVLEQQLTLPQAAGDLPNQDSKSTVNSDMHPEQLGTREVELRKKLALMQQQVLTDPSKIDASADKVPEDTRKLVFESNVVLQAEQMDQAWKILDDTSGFWAWVTGDSAKINGLKSQSAGYYAQWKAVYADIKAKNIDAAQKKYEKLVGDYTFQHFMATMQQAVREAQAKQLLAKLIGMIVITIVSMGVGTIIEGFVGGSVAIAGAVEGGETVGAVTTGLGMGRTAGAVAGFIAETGTFSVASNLLMSKDHSATAILTEFGKNIVMFGAMRGFGKLLEVAGVGKIIKAGAAADATLGAQVAGATAKVATDVAMGGAGVLAGIIEAKIEAAIKNKSLSEQQMKEMIEMNVAQAIIMVIVGRLMQSPMRALKLEAAYKGSKWRMAETAGEHLEMLASPYNKEGAKISEAQLRDIIQKDLAQIQLEKEAFEEVRATLEKQGKSTASIDAHLAELNKYGDASASALLMVGLKAQTPNHFLAPVSDIPVLKAQHLKLGSTWEEVPVKAGEPRTYVVTNAAGERMFITEELPEWAKTPNGQRILDAAKRANIDESVVVGMTDQERNAILKLEKAIDANDAKEIAKAKQELGKLSQAEKDALEKALAESRPKPDQRGKIVDPAQQTELERIRAVDPAGKVRGTDQLSDADVALSMNAQLDKVKATEVDAIIAKFPGEEAHVRQVLAKSSGFGNMDSMNELWSGVAKRGNKLYLPGRGSLADNVMYMAGKGTFKALGGSVTAVSTIEPDTVVILDGVVLAKIKAEPAFAKSLVDNHAKLVNPRGFETGNNMFNSPDPATIAARTEKILKDANAMVQAEGIPFDQAVNRVLDKNVTEALKASGLDAQLQPGQLEDIDPGSHVDVNNSAKIADQLNDHAGITPDKVGQALAGYKEEDAALIREMLAHQAEIFSSRRQAQELKAQSDQVQEAAARKGVADPTNVYYFIYKTNKSYGMLAMAHREMTGTPPDHYVNGPGELRASPIPDSKVLVILDDVAGSGDSLSEAYTQARAAGFKGEIIISPMVSTREAPNAIQNGSAGTPADAKTQFVPKSYANALKDSAWYQSLPPDKQKRLNELIQGLGYSANGLSMAFPYMSPDNNNYWFAGAMADQFIVNNNADAAKNKKLYDPSKNK